jgi:hypothetical protein
MTDVKALQISLMNDAVEHVQEVETKVLSLLTTEQQDWTTLFSDPVDIVISGMLTALTVEEAVKITIAWRDLLPQLITKYHDGYQAQNLNGEAITMKKLFYPQSWLDATGYWKNAPNKGDDVIMFWSNTTHGSSGINPITVVAMMMLTALITVVITLYAVQRKSNAAGGSAISTSTSYEQQPVPKQRSSIRQHLAKVFSPSINHHHHQYERISDDNL